jgi:hypothetical protein
MVNALYAKYDSLNFGVVSWAYWHALTATPHIAAVHFGAALESLRRAYFHSSSTLPVKNVVDEVTWEKIRTALETSLHRWGSLLQFPMFSKARSEISTPGPNIPPARI